MKNQFVPYELSLRLKTFGFNEPCLATYHLKTKEIIEIYGAYQSQPEGDFKNHWILAPLWQQAFDWFTSKGYHSYIEGAHPWFRHYINTPDGRHEGHKKFTLDEAKLSCLENLIYAYENDKSNTLV